MRKNLRKGLVAGIAALLSIFAITAVQTSSAQNAARGALQGVVVDEADSPVIGASVVVKDTPNGVTTDINGKFTLSGLTEGDIIEIGFLGYETQQIAYHKQTNIKVTLRESSIQAEEVVVTALGIKRSEKALSYNVQQVKSDAITTVKDANFMNALSGKVAGVQITSAANGAGGPTRVVMRGVKSLNGSNNALYVIDGVPMSNSGQFSVTDGDATTRNGLGQPTTESIADINPEDIESISVLNGPAAAALYGSSAANGVVLITTKKGQEGKIRITFTNNTTFSNPLMMPEFQNTYGNNSGEYASWGAKGTATNYNPADFFQTGSNVSNGITLSIGNKRNQTYFSAATNNSSAIVPNSKYNRYNFTVRNTTSFLKDKMNLDFGASYILQDQLNPVAAGAAYTPLPAVYMWPRGEDFNEIRAFEEWDPSRNIYVQRWKWGPNAIGTNSLDNPYWEMYRKLRESEKTRYMFNVGFSYDILDWLNLSTRIKLDHTQNRIENKAYATTQAPFQSRYDENNTGIYTQSNSESQDLYGDLLFNINKSWDKVSLSANIGGSFKHQSSRNNSYGGYLGFLPNYFVPANIDNNERARAYGYGQSRIREYAAFANVELGFINALYLTLTARNEWSSTLADTSQLSYFFPSVGLSVVVSELVDMPDWFNYLKVRGSFADVGSPLTAGLTEFYYTWNGSAASQPEYRPVTHLYPEKTDSWEAGVTMRFLKHLSVDLTFYRSDTKKQTIPVDISAASGGFNKMYIQTGRVRNQGLELAVGYSNEWRGFGWSSNFTYSTNRNRIIELFGSYYDPVTDRTFYPSDIAIQSGNNPIAVGNSMGDIYTKRDFARDSEGNIFVDSNGEIKIVDLSEARKLGSSLPKGNLGWNNSFSYKGLNLNILFTARLGGLATSYTQMFLDQMGVSKASADARDAGGIRVNNGYIDAQKYFAKVASPGGGLIQEYVYDATNVRLQELSLGYTLPRKWFNDKLNLTVSLVGRNLWMIYCKAPFDPDLSYSTGTYSQSEDYLMMPSLRNLGFSVKFDF